MKQDIQNQEFLKSEVLAGKIFIYPTDTIYGLGCDALNQEAVNKIKEIKFRDKDKPISIIAPNITWILENFEVNEEEIKKYLPGPYTLLLKKKNPIFLSWISNNDRIGVRIPNQEFCFKIQETGVPFVTTSVNSSGEPFAKSIKEIKSEILDKVDYVIDIGELNGNPSTLIIDGKPLERK
ncbi:threonylcarbamoyl-AMP synthase [Candidatus Pacearchaeota archaeon]|nr:threonylcarbamoyl-AMP synthase [Candidatus Pacearchaeota archaeon]